MKNVIRQLFLATFVSALAAGCNIEEMLNQAQGGQGGEESIPAPTAGGSSTGGTTAIGGASATGGTTVTTSVPSTGGSTSCSSDWHGYSYAVGSPGTTVDRDMFDFYVTPGVSLGCFTGMVEAKADWSGYFVAGFNIQQEEQSAVLKSCTMPAGSYGLQVRGTNRFASTELRLQIADGDGNDPARRWCARITLSGTDPVVVPMLSFKTNCWDNTGKRFVEDPKPTFNSVAIAVPGEASLAKPYDFCIDDISVAMQ